jgi:hypothetical protein
MSDDDDVVVIIQGYRTRVRFYGLVTARAWVLVASLLAVGFVLGKVF